MRATKLLPAIMLLFVSLTASAQDYNPFKSIGKKGKILTLSNGKYVEFFDYDTIQRIGTVLINIRTKKVVKLLNAGEINKKFSDNSSTSRWYSVDPLAYKYFSSSPYNFVDNNPISRIDPTGKNWFYYQGQGEKDKSWHWQKGNKASYTNTDGKTITTKKGFENLVVYKVTGTNSEGAKTGTLTVYNQNKAVLTNTAFTGGVNGTNPTLPGNYMMNLSVRDAVGPTKMNATLDNPEAAWGIQKIPHKYINPNGVGTNDGGVPGSYNIQGPYGTGRIRLMETNENGDISSEQTHGYYLHGKQDTHNITHGCICDKSEAVFNYFWSGDGKDIRGKVPFSVQ